jgi:hypothetical protein
MAKKKRKGLGATVEVDIDGAGAGAYSAVGMTRNIMPPGRTRAKIDGTVLTDVLSTNESGIEEHSEFKFLQLWDPNETEDEKIDTLFGNGNVADWKVTYPNTVTDVFSGWVSEIAPETIEIAGLLGREVTVQRTTAITRTGTPS